MLQDTEANWEENTQKEAHFVVKTVWEAICLLQSLSRHSRSPTGSLSQKNNLCLAVPNYITQS